MAGSSNFLIFDESKTNVMSDANYQAAAQRQNGVIPGVAAPDLHNKIYRQASVMAYALAAVMAERGETVNDANPSGVISAIRRAFAYSVNGDKPDQAGDVQTGKPIDAWPIGSIFLSATNANPATMLGGGTWQRIKGKYLLAADDSDYTLGTEYGSMTKTLTVSQMPAHNHTPTVTAAGGHSHTVSVSNSGAHAHSASSANNGAHNHTATVGSAGGHAHTATAASNGAHTHSVSGDTGNAGKHSHGRGNLNIKASGFMGEHWTTDENSAYTKFRNQASGALRYSGSNKYGSEGGIDHDDYVGDFDATRCSEWVNGTTSEASNHKHSVSLSAASNGAHAHTITVNSAGGHAHTATIDQNGTHNHGITVNEAAAHTHGATVSSVSDHNHSVSVGNTGGGQAFDVKPLSVAVYVWIRVS